jgi:anti-repressor protein
MEETLMSSLIPVNYDNDRQTVSARMLHEFLEIETQYSIWFERMVGYGFARGTDFEAINQKRLTAQGNETSYTDHQITIEMAKELCMIQRTEKGKQARQYFIELERQWNSPEAVFARALKMADRKILSLETQVKELTPAAEFGNAVSNNAGGLLIRDYVKVLENDGIKIGQDKFFSWLHVNGYIYRQKGYKPQWIPYKQYVEQGLFRIKETPVSTPQQGDWISITIRITGKGQRYFYEKLKHEAA